MLHHERLRPPSRDYPADEWNVIEKAFRPEFLASSKQCWRSARDTSACAGARRKGCIVLCHATEQSAFTLTCATDNALESSCPQWTSDSTPTHGSALRGQARLDLR